MNELLMCPELWEMTNRRRGELIDRQVAGTITTAEAEILDRLNIIADAYLESVAPRDTALLDRLESQMGLSDPIHGCDR